MNQIKPMAEMVPEPTNTEIHDRLEYLADILQDLQGLVGGTGGATLNGLLALARAEALLQSQRIRSQKENF